MIQPYEIPQSLLGPIVRFYYSKCPGTVIPFLLLHMASENQLEVAERARRITYTDDKYKHDGVVLCQFSTDDVKILAQTDNAGRHILDRWRSNGLSQFSLLLHYDKKDPVLREIRTILQDHDDPIIQTTEQRQALFQLSQELINAGRQYLQENYLVIVAMLVDACGLFPGSEDLRISALEASLIGEFNGKAFYPYARLAYLSALLPQAETVYEYSVYQDPESKLTTPLAKAVSMLIALWRGNKGQKFIEVGKMGDGLEPDAKYGLVVSNRISKGEFATALANAMKHTFPHLAPNALFIGLDGAQDFFNITCRQSLYLSALVEGRKLDSLILLPRRYNAVMLVARNDKTEDTFRIINLWNTPIPMAILTRKSYKPDLLLKSHTRVISFDELRARHCSVGEFFRYAIPPAEKEGMELVPLKTFISRIEKSSSSFGQVDARKGRLYEPDINPAVEYDHRHYKVYSRPCLEDGVFEPTYFLDYEALLINDKGNIEPRLFIARSYSQTTVCRNGLAFSFRNNVYPPYIINELSKDYVRGQLSDWTFPRDIHCEDDILNLKIWTPVDADGEPDTEEQEKICNKELDSNFLPAGTVIDDKVSHCEYTVEESLGAGAFGLTYMATRSGHEPKTVVLKEFFVKLPESRSSRNRDLTVSHSIGTIDGFRHGIDFSAEKRRFVEEFDKMHEFGFIPDSHVRRALNVFTSRRTNNIYFVMDYYQGGNLNQLAPVGTAIPEKEATRRFIIPLAKALNVLHTNRCVHLDLKPENVIIDDNGLALLGDLGIAREYNEDGHEISSGGYPSRSDYAPDEEGKVGMCSEFHPQMDIYALGAIFYQLLTGNNPTGFDPEDLNDDRISEGARKAIIGAMEKDWTVRTANVMDFVHCLPGHEEDVFQVGKPVYDNIEEAVADDDFDYSL